MFIFSMKLSRKKIAIIAGAVIAAILLCFYFIQASKADQKLDYPVSSSHVKIAAKGLATNDQRILYLKSLGLLVSTEPVDIAEITIPKEFDDVYEKYNQIQKQAGLDLSKYKNKTCMRYSYEVYNMDENNEQPVRVNIFLYKDQVIAGDISSVTLDGFMLPLNHLVK